MKKTIITCLAVFVSLCVLHADPDPAQPTAGDCLKNCFIVVTRGDDGKTVELPMDRRLSVHLKSDTVWFRDAKAEKHWTSKGGSLKTWIPNLIGATDEPASLTKDGVLKFFDDNIFTSEPVWDTGKKAPDIQEGVSHDEFIFEPQKVGDTKITFHLRKTVVDKKGKSSEKCEDKVSFNVHVVEALTPPAPAAPTEQAESVTPPAEAVTPPAEATKPGEKIEPVKSAKPEKSVTPAS